MTSKPCFHCYKLGHSSREACPNDGLIACTRCFRTYVFSNGCNCLDKRQPEPCQVLRLIGKPKAPRWFTDLKIRDQTFPAMLNSSISRCRVSSVFANWWNSLKPNKNAQDANMILLEIQRKGRCIRITCDVTADFEDDLHIQIGTELMTFLGYTLTMENISVKSNHSPVLSTPYEIEYVYNLPTVGVDLRDYLIRKRHFIKKRRTATKHCVNFKPNKKRIVILRRSSSISSNSSNSSN